MTLQVKIAVIVILGCLLVGGGFYGGYKVFNKDNQPVPTIANNPTVHTTATNSTVQIKPPVNSNCPEITVTNGTASSVTQNKPTVAQKEVKPRVSIGGGINKPTVPKFKELGTYYLEFGVRLIDEVWLKGRMDGNKNASVGLEYRF